MDDIEWRSNSIKKELGNYDFRSMPVCKDTINEYVAAVQAVNETVDDCVEEINRIKKENEDLRKTFTDWLGNHLRDFFGEDKSVTIHINAVGQECKISAPFFSDRLFDELKRLEVKYGVSSDDYGNCVVMVKLW